MQEIQIDVKENKKKLEELRELMGYLIFEIKKVERNRDALITEYNEAHRAYYDLIRHPEAY